MPIWLGLICMEHTFALQDAKIGDFVQVRGKEWLVEEVSVAEDLPILTLVYISDDSQGEELKVLPAVEVDSSIISENNWEQIGLTSHYLNHIVEYFPKLKI